MKKKRKKKTKSTTRDDQSQHILYRLCDRCAFFVKKIWDNPLIASGIFFLVFFGTLTTIYALAEGDPIFDDHYFHFKYAYLLRTEGLDAVNHFDWIYLSGHGADGGSRYTVSLFQVSLIPFTYFTDWLFGLHVADAFYGSVVVALLYFIMRKERVRHPLFFALLLIGSIFFLSRILLGRALVLMIGLVFLEMYFAIRKKYVPLFFVVLVHVLWHQSTYFLPLVIVGVVEVSRYLVEKKIDIKNFLIALGGIVCGMIFFPGFPKSLYAWLLWIFAIRQNSVDNANGSLGGNEMATSNLMSYTFTQAITGVAVIFCTMAVGYMYYLYKKEDHVINGSLRTRQMHWLCCLTIFLLCMIGGSYMVTGRLLDFVAPSLVLLMGFTITALLDTQLIPQRFFAGKGFVIFMWLIVLALCAQSLMVIYTKSNTFDYQPARLAAQWIDEHSEDGEKVYLHNWSYFSLMFFENSHNRYSMGIEPLALKAYDESLYWKYYNIFATKYYCELPKACRDELYDELMVKRTDAETRNAFRKENSEKVINSIKNDFGARIILSNSEELSRTIAMSPELIEDYYEVWSDKFKGDYMSYTVFKLK